MRSDDYDKTNAILAHYLTTLVIMPTGSAAGNSD